MGHSGRANDGIWRARTALAGDSHSLQSSALDVYHRGMYVYENASAIELSGDADLASSGALSILETQLQGRENIVFDVTGLESVDSTFLRFLVRLKQHAAKEELATVELVGVKPNLRRILEVTGLARMFSLQPRSDARPKGRLNRG